MPDLQDVISTVAAPFVAGANMVSRALGPIANPAISRLMSSGLGSARTSLGPSVRFWGGSSANENSWKVRISIAPNSPILYNDASGGLLNPLTETGGVVFPYTPQITTTYQAMYTSQRFTHSNYTHLSYDNSEIQQIQISADFTAQNENEARYVLACIYFFRAATKMFFGQGELAGNPPPIVFLNGYGEHYFPNVPCVITTFTHTMPQEVDYIDASVFSVGASDDYRKVGFDTSTGAGEFGSHEQGSSGNSGILTRSKTTSTTKVPTVSQFVVALQPVYSKRSLTEFNLNDFAQGKLTSKRFI